MSHLNRHVKAATQELGKAAADVSESVGSVVHAVVDNAHDAAHQMREKAGRVAEEVHGKCQQVGHAVRNTFDHGRDRAVRWENDFEQMVRSRPIVSVLIAAGIGAIVGVLWHRRRP